MTIVYVIQLCVPCSGILIKCFVCYYYACIKCIVRVPCVICFVLVGRADHALVMIKDDGCTVPQLCNCIVLMKIKHYLKEEVM